MTYTNYSASQAVTRANGITKWQTAMCLNFVMYCVHNERVGLSDANAAWTEAKQKEYSGTPPAGAPVYFSGYEHGHIAISLGGGKIRSTDVPYATAKGTLAPVGNTTIGDICRDWGIKYRGWSRDYAGLIIRGLEETNTNYSPPPVTQPEGFLMALTDAQQTALYNRVMGGIPDGKAAGRNNPDGTNARVLDSADGNYLRLMLVDIKTTLAAIEKKLGA